MRKYAALLALLVLLAPFSASAENYPETLGLPLPEIARRTGNLKCTMAENPLAKISWLCQYKYFGGLDVNEEYLISDDGHVNMVIVTTLNLSPTEAVNAYKEEYLWNLCFYGVPRRLIRNQDARPQHLVREVAREAFSEIAIWHTGNNNFVLVFLIGDAGEITISFFYAPFDAAASLLKKMTNIGNPHQILLPDNGH